MFSKCVFFTKCVARVIIKTRQSVDKCETLKSGSSLAVLVIGILQTKKLHIRLRFVYLTI